MVGAARFELATPDGEGSAPPLSYAVRGVSEPGETTHEKGDLKFSSFLKSPSGISLNYLWLDPRLHSTSMTCVLVLASIRS
tara:strand:- start:1923 stop:2165 length:243 start_codon:yes stop_codon:yes gene_type:complete